MIDLTRGQIIEDGLDRAGRLDLRAQGRLWLNLFLEKIYHNQDYHWLIKDAGDLPATQNQDVPLDYRAAANATFGAPGNVLPLTILWDVVEFDAHRNLLDSTPVSRPQFVYIDHITRKIVFLPVADSTQVWNLKYYHLPDLPDFNDPNTDNDIPLWRAPFSILTDAIFQKALEFNDDTRQQASANDLKVEIAENKKNNHDRRAGKSRLKMGKSFRNRFR